VEERKTVKVYLVQRLSWEYGDDFYYRCEDEDAPMVTFRDRNRAEAHRRQLEWDYVCQSKVNPFGWVDASLEERSSLPTDQLLERLREAGMQVDGEGNAMHQSLWDQYDTLAEPQRQLVWDAIDRIRFFGLVEMTVDLED
jgi:hypothetical protein